MNNAHRKKSQQITRLYDSLSRFVQLFNWLKFSDRYAGFTMHKNLIIPEEQQNFYQGKMAGHYINDLALSAAHLPENPSVLDAGCGFGGTIFRWFQKKKGRYDGITLSRRQIAVAQKEAIRRKISKHCRFYLRSFDEPVQQEYDVIVAIESLIHSENLEKTLLNLRSGLKNNGRLVIVDDLLHDTTGICSDQDYVVLKQNWYLTKICSVEELLGLLKKVGFQLQKKTDLTTRVPLADLIRLQRQQKILSSLKKRALLPQFKSFLAAYLGGVALQKLYARGKMSYLLLTAS